MKFSILQIGFLLNIYAGRKPAFETTTLAC